MADRDRENNTSAEFMVEHDTEYVENYSFILGYENTFSKRQLLL